MQILFSLQHKVQTQNLFDAVKTTQQELKRQHTNIWHTHTHIQS